MQTFMEKLKADNHVDDNAKNMENPVQKKSVSAIDYLKPNNVMQLKTENDLKVKSDNHVDNNVQNTENPVQKKSVSAINYLKPNNVMQFQTENDLEVKTGKGRTKLGRIFKGGLSGIAATNLGGYGSKDERRPEYKPDKDYLNGNILEDIEIDIPGKKIGSNNKLRGHKYIPKNNPNGKAVILFSGSGGSNISQLFKLGIRYAANGYTCYAVDYRGFGKSGRDNGDGSYSSGMISEKRIYEDSRIIYNYVLNKGFSPNNIILHGYSLGAAVASNLAVEVSQKANKYGNNADEHRLGGLVMHSPSTSTYNEGKAAAGWLGGRAAKNAMGNMSTKNNLEMLNNLDNDLPIAFVSGQKKEGDHLDYTNNGTNLISVVKNKNKIIEDGRAKANHLSVGKHINNMNKHMDAMKNMSRTRRT